MAQAQTQTQTQVWTPEDAQYVLDAASELLDVLNEIVFRHHTEDRDFNIRRMLSDHGTEMMLHMGTIREAILRAQA